MRRKTYANACAAAAAHPFATTLANVNTERLRGRERVSLCLCLSLGQCLSLSLAFALVFVFSDEGTHSLAAAARRRQLRGTPSLSPSAWKQKEEATDVTTITAKKTGGRCKDCKCDAAAHKSCEIRSLLSLSYQFVNWHTCTAEKEGVREFNLFSSVVGSGRLKCSGFVSALSLSGSELHCPQSERRERAFPTAAAVARGIWNLTTKRAPPVSTHSQGTVFSLSALCSGCPYNSVWWGCIVHS